jgi:uncharacterized protein with HEPN domain
MRNERSDQLNEAIQLCTIHSERMRFAWGKVNTNFPLTVEKYNSLQPEVLSFFDQLIFRFSKLQDSMGSKLFPALLENLGEETRGIPMIDLLTKMEELELLQNANDWLVLRETRNIVTHEYPFITREVIDGLNLLGKHQKLIITILQQLLDIIDVRFNKG